MKNQTVHSKCDELLVAMLGKKELVNLWWTSPNKAFGNNTPNFAYDQSPTEVLGYLNSHAHGEW
jgi:hypothetical protein